MRARDVMTAEVVTVSPGTGIMDAARLMLDRRISGAPVVDDGGRLVGIISEGDLMRRAELTTEGQPWWLAAAASPEEKARAYTKAYGLTVGDVMTKDVVTIGEEEPLDRIAMLFEARGIKRAPVLRDGKIVGIVSRANLLQGVAAGRFGKRRRGGQRGPLGNHGDRKGGGRRARLARRRHRRRRNLPPLGQRGVRGRARRAARRRRDDEGRARGEGPRADSPAVGRFSGARIELASPARLLTDADRRTAWNDACTR